MITRAERALLTTDSEPVSLLFLASILDAADGLRGFVAAVASESTFEPQLRELARRRLAAYDALVEKPLVGPRDG